MFSAKTETKSETKTILLSMILLLTYFIINFSLNKKMTHKLYNWNEKSSNHECYQANSCFVFVFYKTILRLFEITFALL